METKRLGNLTSILKDAPFAQTSTQEVTVAFAIREAFRELNARETAFNKDDVRLLIKEKYPALEPTISYMRLASEFSKCKNHGAQEPVNNNRKRRNVKVYDPKLSDIKKVLKLQEDVGISKEAFCEMIKGLREFGLNKADKCMRAWMN